VVRAHPHPVGDRRAGRQRGYVFWLDFADRKRSHLDFAIGGIERMDRIVTGPAYLVLLLSGIVLILIEAFPITEFWLLAGIVLYFVSGLTSFLVLAPSLRNQLALAGAGDLDGQAYRAARTRSWVTAWAIVAIVAIVVGLMVLKPVF
jgi:uncharacterized membrane protein